MAFTLNPNWSTLFTQFKNTSWNVLDLSALIGDAGSYLVFFIVTPWASSGTSGNRVAFRPSGSAGDWRGGTYPFGPHWPSWTAYTSNRIACQVTNTASVIEARENSSTVGVKIYVLGWCPVIPVTNTFSGPGVLPAIWADADLSAVIGTARPELLFCQKVGAVSDTESNGLRLQGDNFDPPVNGAHAAGINLSSGYSTGRTNLLVSPVDSTQILQYGQIATGTHSATLSLMARSQLWTQVNEVVYEDLIFPVAATTFTDLDLSPWVGKRRVAAVVKTRRHSGVNATPVWYNFKPKDIPLEHAGGGTDYTYNCSQSMANSSAASYIQGSYAFVITDENGVAEWSCSTGANLPIQLTLVGYLDEPLASINPYRVSPLALTKEATLDLSYPADSYDALAASGGDILVEAISFYVETAGATITSVSVKTDQTSVTIVLTSAEGAVANLVSQKNLDFAFGTFPFRLSNGQVLQYTIDGASGSGSISMSVCYRPVTSGSGATLIEVPLPID